MEVDRNLCSFTLPESALPARQGFNGYRCEERNEPGKSLCIFHDPKPNKERGAFSSKLQLKTDNCFIGYVFPIEFRFPIDKFKNADFAHSHFHGKPDFQGSVFWGETDFSLATFHQGVHFNEAIFKGDVYFTGALFSGQAWFREVTLNGYMSLISTHFKDEVWFDGISDVIADIIGTIFEKEAHFHNTAFATGSFIETQFRERATFGCFKHLGNVLDLEQASRSPDVVFFEGVDMKQLLFREANLERASFNQCYNFDQARFYDCTWNFESGRNHVLYDELYLRKKVLPWEQIARNEGRLRNSEFAKRIVDNPAKHDQATESLLEGKYAVVEETCRALKKHFEDRRNFLVAGDFHEGEMEMRRLAKGSWGRNFLSVEAVYWRLSRYGQRWLRPLGWLIGLIFAAAVVYSATGLQLSGSGSGIRWKLEQELSSKSFFDLLYVYAHSLLYSVSVSALMRGVVATPTHFLGLFVQTLQFILGPLLLFLIGLAIRRRLRR